MEQTVTFTTENLTALVNAIATGARKVKYADKEVTYNSLDDMLKLKKLMENDLGISSTRDNGRRRFASFTKGT